MIREYSDDRRRGESAHLQRAVAAVRGLKQQRCQQCGAQATHTIAGQMPLCADHAKRWKKLGPQEQRAWRR